MMRRAITRFMKSAGLRSYMNALHAASNAWRLLSPTHLDTGIEVVEHMLPSGKRFPGSPRLGVTVDKYVVVTEGALTVEIEGASYPLDVADAMYFRINGDYCFVNKSRRKCRYYLFIVHRRQ